MRYSNFFLNSLLSQRSFVLHLECTPQFTPASTPQSKRVELELVPLGLESVTLELKPIPLLPMTLFTAIMIPALDPLPDLDKSTTLDNAGVDTRGLIQEF